MSSTSSVYISKIKTIIWTPRNRYQFSSVQSSVMSNSLRPHELQHARPLCPLPTPRDHSNSCALGRWCHPAISSSVVPFSCFNLSQHQGLFQWVNFSHEVAKVLEFQPQHQSFQWTPWTGLLQNGLVGSPCSSKGLSRAFSNTTVQKHHFFGAQPSSQSNSHIHTWPQEKP